MSLAPTRSGHAPHDLREAFAEALYLYMQSKIGDPLPSVELRGNPVDLVSLTGLLWNCTDAAPRDLGDEIASVVDHYTLSGLQGGGKTYAQCVRHLRQHLAWEAAAA